MKEERLLQAMTNIDDRLIRSHDPAGAAPSRGRRPFRVALLAAAVTALLTTAALALSPTLRDTLGAFWPYAQDMTEGKILCVDQDVEVRVASALSDGNTIIIYFEARDLTGDRLDGHTSTNMQIQWPTGQVEWSQGMLVPSKQISYDPETGTALYVGKFIGDGIPAQDPVVSLSGQAFLPDHHFFDAPLPDEVISGETLQTEVLPTGEEVLRPMQNAAPLMDGLLALSSCGYGADGVFHLQLRLERGKATTWLNLRSRANSDQGGYERTQRYNRMEKVEFQRDGVTYIDFATGATGKDAGDVVLLQLMAEVKGAPEIEGQWTLSVPLKSQPTTAIDLSDSGTETAMGTRATRLLLSPISCTVESAPQAGKGSMGHPLALFLADGRVIANIKCDSGYYSEGYATNHWTFPEPIRVEEVTAVALGLWCVPVEGGQAQEGHWLAELPQ